jgi:hypothetical protein
MGKFFSPYLAYQTLFVKYGQTLYHTNQGLSKTSYQVYNVTMSRDHFAQMYRNKSTRHDQKHDSYEFNEVITGLCGMLYSVVTLKCFFPPRQNSAEDQPENKITKA